MGNRNRTLRQAIDRHFDTEELQTLCFDLGVDYDGLRGSGKAAKGRELVAYMQRCGHLGLLTAAIRRERPDISIDPTETRLTRAVRRWLSNINNFSQYVVNRPLRDYQLEPAQAILNSILTGQGNTYAVMMSRQAGKNELSGQLEAYLLNLYRFHGGQIVKASPTFKPQTVNSIMRLTDRLANPWNEGHWRRREGYIVEMGKARTLFFSAGPGANVVGATADLLLECDEAQDVGTTKWSKDFKPMGASTNVTTVLWGTAWTSNTLLAETIHHLKRQQARDGHRRVFTYDADRVGAEVPAYANYVTGEVARLGRNHPLIKTQYYLEEIDAQGGLFPEIRRALMRGDHPRRHEPRDGQRYALLIDVAGEDEQAGDALTRATLVNKKRDATALTVVEVDTGFGRLPTYRAVDRRLWLGIKHTSLHGQITALARHWNAVWVIVDATGIGAGLGSFLTRSLGEKVIPVLFSPKVKSDLGWNFLGIVETGRYRDYIDDQKPDTRQFWYEVGHCQYEVRDGPGQAMRWGVWESPGYDGVIAYGHDDLLISAALTAILDQQDWPGTGESAVVEHPDELDEIDQGEW